MTLSQQGRIMDSAGVPLDSAATAVRFSLFNTPSGGTAVWTDTIAVDFENGYYSTTLGMGVEMDDADFADDDLYLAIQIGAGAELGSRMKVSSVPFAVRAGSVSGGIVDASEIKVNGVTVIDGFGSVSGASDTVADLSCSDGDVVRYDGSSWGCAADNDHEHDAASLTSGQLLLARLPVGNTSSHVAAGNHTHTSLDSLDIVGGLDVGGTIHVGASSDACGSSLDGAIRYDSVDKELLFCDGTDWIVFAAPQGPLGTVDNPGTSCKQLLDAGASTGDGNYWLGLASPKLTFCNRSAPPGDPDFMLVTPDQFYHGDQFAKFGATNGSNVFDYGCDFCGAAQIVYQYPCPDTNWSVSYYQMRSHCNHSNHIGNDTVFNYTTYIQSGIEGVQVQQIGDACGDPNEMTMVGVCSVTGTSETDPGGWDAKMRNVSWSN